MRSEMQSNTIVEVGFGPRPFPIHGTRRLQPGERYIGVDPVYWAWSTKPGPDPLELSVERMVDTNPDADFELKRLPGEKLPFEDDSIDEVLIQNVMGDPNVGTKKGIEILKEAARVVRVGGSLTLVETTTPLNFLSSQARAYLTPLGFIQTNLDREQDTDDILRYNSFALFHVEGQYIAIFEKQKI